MLPKICLFILLGLLLNFEAECQPVHFSIWHLNPYEANGLPALSSEGSRLIFFVRNQTPGFNAFTTYGLAGLFMLEKYNSRLGFSLLNDDQGAGVFVSRKFRTSYNYKVIVQKKFRIDFSWFAGIQSKTINYQRLNFGGSIPIDAELLLKSNTNQLAFTTGAGFGFRSANFWITLALPELVELALKNSSENHENKAFSLSAGYIFDLNQHGTQKPDWQIIPVIKIQQYDFQQQVNTGVLWRKDWFEIDLWTRTNLLHLPVFESIILGAGFKFGRYRLNYAYDVSMLRVNRFPGGSHECVLTLLLADKEKFKQNGTISCPAF